MSKPLKKILVFVALTFALSTPFYVLSILSISISKYMFLFLWCPGIAGMVTQLIFERSLRGMGWTLRPLKYQLASYLTPLAYVLLAYLLLWVSGLWPWPFPLSSFYLPNIDPPRIDTDFSILISILILLAYFLRVATVVVLTSMLTALGEEIGWRGLLVPELAKITSYSKTSLISGFIWALYHMPILLFACYHSAGSPVWYSLICFTIMAIAICFAFTWLRVKSGSLWTAVILHAAHNAFVQAFFKPMTTYRTYMNYKAYFIDELGLFLVLAMVIAGVVFWLKRGALPATSAVGTS